MRAICFFGHMLELNTVFVLIVESRNGGEGRYAMEQRLFESRSGPWRMK
jgi:hypothetical protein